VVNLLSLLLHVITSEGTSFCFIQAYDVRRGEGHSGYEWVKREIVLCDETTTVLVKLWYALSASTCVAQNSRILIQNVEIEKFQGRVTLATTDESTCQVGT